MYPMPLEKCSPAVRWLYRLALPLALFLWLLPLLAVMLTSLRSIADINAGNYWGWPSELKGWDNYQQIFIGTPMLRYLGNTLLIVVPSVLGCLVVASLAGFALARYHFRGRLLLFAMFIAGNFVPFQILMIPVRDLSLRFGLYDTTLGLVLFHVAFQTGFCTLFLRNFIVLLPESLMEAARVEGAREWTIFYRIVLPLIRPALAAVAVLVFTFVWNDFFWSLILVQSDEVRPVTAGLNALRGQWLASWQLISAGSIVAALPPVFLFFLMQRHFVTGLTLGANKG